jgi:hypothetical protein
MGRRIRGCPSAAIQHGGNRTELKPLNFVSMIFSRRRFLLLGTGAAALPATARISWAQNYPTRPIKLINAIAAGSAPDILSRIIAEPLSRALGQQVVVENRAGGAGLQEGVKIRARLHLQPFFARGGNSRSIASCLEKAIALETSSIR